MSNDNTTISFSEIFKSLFSQIKFIITVAIISLAIILTIGLILKPQYQISAAIKLNNFTNIDNIYNNGLKPIAPINVYYDIVSQTSFESAMESLDLNLYFKNVSDKSDKEVFSYKQFRKIISVDCDSSSNFINFFIKSTDKPDFYIDLLSTIIENTSQKLKDENIPLINHAIENRTNELNSVTPLIVSKETALSSDSLKSNNDMIVYAISLQKEINAMNNYIDEMQTPILYETIFTPVKLHSKILSIQTIAILGIIIGLITLCVALFIDLADSHINKTNDIFRAIPDKYYLGALPATSNLDVSQKHLSYIFNNNPIDKKINLTSVSPDSGIDNIEKNLKIMTENEILRKESILTDPKNAITTDDTYCNIILLKAGYDTKKNLKLITSNLAKNDIDFKYILNYVDSNDPNLIQFPNSETVKKNLFTSFKAFYKKLYR